MSTVEKRRCDRCQKKWPSMTVTCRTGYVHGQCQRCAQITRRERQEHGDITFNFPPETDLSKLRCYHFPLKEGFIRRISNRVRSFR
jgi:hypothetical protein